MISETLKNYLKAQKVSYKGVSHPKRFTAQEIAQAEHAPGREVAKAVIVKAKGRDWMVVTPADSMIDLLKLSAVLETDDIRVEEEREFAPLFPECELGAMPPIGKLYGMNTFVDESFLKNREIFFNGGDHKESIVMPVSEYIRIAEAEIADFAVRREILHA